MRRLQNSRLVPALLVALVLSLAAIGWAQGANTSSQSLSTAGNVPVAAGQKLEIEGTIQNQQGDSLIVRSPGGGTYSVTLSPSTEITEKKKNLFRGAKKYTRKDLLQGLYVEVKGVGESSGTIAAKEIRLRNDDFLVAQTMDTRVVPVEQELKATQNRLSETEQNAQRLSGQIQEVSAISNAARDNAKTAQTSADNAMAAANTAQSSADNAKTGVQAANERITSLDEYSVKNTTTVHFKAGSSNISKDDQSQLDALAEQAKAEKGFLIEVAGFASSDGDVELNRRLSRKRADAVIQFLAENHGIPLRRFVVPMGYGESQPVGDNDTRDGRKENRRVEVRILVSKGLVSAPGATGSDATATNRQQ